MSAFTDWARRSAPAHSEAPGPLVAVMHPAQLLQTAAVLQEMHRVVPRLRPVPPVMARLPVLKCPQAHARRLIHERIQAPQRPQVPEPAKRGVRTSRFALTAVPRVPRLRRSHQRLDGGGRPRRRSIATREPCAR